MFSLGRSNRSSTATDVNRGVSPLSSDGRRLTINPSRRARISTASGRASGANAEGVMTTRAIGLLRRAKSAITSSISSMPPSTGIFRIDWPRSELDGDSRPTGQIRLTAPLSIPRNRISASAARPTKRVGTHPPPWRDDAPAYSENNDRRSARRSGKTPPGTSKARW